MKIIPGHPPAALSRTHVKVLNASFMHELESYGVPLRRYSLGTGIVWAERWACILVDEWTSLLSATNVVGFDVLRRVVSYVQRTGELEFAPACLAVLRLNGIEGVEAMLTERKDLVKRC